MLGGRLSRLEVIGDIRMAKRIFKYQLDFIGSNTCVVQMKTFQEILSCQIQDGRICIWATVWDDTEEGPVEFVKVGTGWNLDMGVLRTSRFLGTVQTKGGLVWHIFQV